ncbi:hypothetical protein [Actinosynnema mirum]|uniref:hypothetical protein n=1 Tax=Actinosynnema mirum TaxID=40567 RepID=UPI00117DF84A|nr:hypothetical protein [Actinosynnema mirum]
MTDNSVRVLLDPRVEQEDVEEASLELLWLFLEERPHTDSTPHEHVWLDELSEVYAHFVRDDLLGVSFLLLHGDDVPEAERAVRAVLPTVTLEEVVAALATASDDTELVNALRFLAAALPVETPELVGLLTATARSGAVNARGAFVTAAAYLEWPRLLDEVARLRDEDPDQGVRANAAIVLDAIA